MPRSTAIPDEGKPITDSDGIQLLVQLFYDDNRFREYKITKSPIAMNQYMEFLIQMTQLNQPDNTGMIDKYKQIIRLENPQQKKAQGEGYSADRISDDKMKEVCANHNVETQVIGKNTAKGAAVLQKVGQLFGAQVAHASKCGQLLKQLFTIVTVEGTQSLVINRTIFLKGISEINRINRLARQILMAYYKKCEELFRAGVAAIVKDDAAPIAINKAVPDTPRIPQPPNASAIPPQPISV